MEYITTLIETILRSGTCKQLYTAIECLLPEERKWLAQTKVDMMPIADCMQNLRLDWLSTLFERGITFGESNYESLDNSGVDRHAYNGDVDLDSTDDIRRSRLVRKNSSFAVILSAVSTAAVNHCPRLLDLVLKEARLRGRLSEFIATISTVDNCVGSLADVWAWDCAPVLDLLLDAGLFRMPPRRDENRFDGASSYGAASAVDELAICAVVRAAARQGALACLRTLRARLPLPAWQRALDKATVPPREYPFWPALSLQLSPPLVATFKSSPACFNFLVSQHDPARLDLLPTAAEFGHVVPFLMQQHHSFAPLRQRTTLTNLLPRASSAPDSAAAAHVIYEGWDTLTRAQIFFGLAHCPDRADPHALVRYLLRLDYGRAVATLLRFGCHADDVLLFETVRSGEAVEALLDALTDVAAEALRRAAPEQAVDAAAVRREVVRKILAVDSGRLFVRLVIESRFGAALALAKACMSARLPFRLTNHMPESRSLLHALATSKGDPSVTLELARAVIGFITPQRVMPNEAELLLRCALASDQLALAQLFVENGGAYVFFETNMFEYVPRATPRQWQRCRLPPELLPAGADPALEAADPAAFAQFSRKEAAAAEAAADAEEERLLAALLKDPCALTPPGKRGLGALVTTWLDSIKPALTTRWIWKQMCEDDWDTAVEYLCSTATTGDARRVRFCLGHAARAPPVDCRGGNYEAAWASVLAQDAGKGAAFTHLSTAVLRGHMFADGIAREIAPAEFCRSFSLTSVFFDDLLDEISEGTYEELPGEFCRMIRVVLSLAKDFWGSPA